MFTPKYTHYEDCTFDYAMNVLTNPLITIDQRNDILGVINNLISEQIKNPNKTDIKEKDKLKDPGRSRFIFGKLKGRFTAYRNTTGKNREMVECENIYMVDFIFKPELLDDTETVKKCLQYCEGIFQYVGDDCKKDKDVVMQAVKYDPSAIRYASQELRSDKEVVLEAVKHHPQALHYVSQELRSDKQIMLEALSSASSLKKCVHHLMKNTSLLNDEAFIADAFRANPEIINSTLAI